MKRIVLYNIFISTGISLICIIYWLFISDVSKSLKKVFDYIGGTLLCILTLLWNGLLLGTLVHSPRLNEPQTYLIVLIFLANALRSVPLVVLEYVEDHPCPHIEIEHGLWNDSTYQVYNDNHLLISYITALSLNSIISWTLLVILISRFYLSFKDEKHICKKVKCMVVLLIVAPCSIIKAYCGIGGGDFDLISICFTGSPYAVMFLLLIAYSARIQYDYPTEMNYFVLRFLFLLFGSVLIPLDIFLTSCIQSDLDDFTLNNFVKTNLFAGIIIPLILLLIDKNLRRGLFDYFPNTPRITESLSDNNEQRHLIGTVVEDERLGAQRGEFPSDDPKSSAQTIENVFPEDSELKAPCNEFGPEDTEYKAPQQYKEDCRQ